MSKIQEVANIVIAGRAKLAAGAVQAALDEGCDPNEILGSMIDAMGEVGAMGKMIIGTVAGDLHDIGKNLVAMMIESAGFEVIDLGVDVPHERFVQAVQENPGVKIVGLSALLTTTMTALRDAVALLNQQDFRKDIKVMVGGAPITAAFAEEIGADAYTPDAASAAIKAKELVAKFHTE